MYVLPWMFGSDLRFHEILQTTIIRQITKGNEEIEKKNEKYGAACVNNVIDFTLLN